VTFPRLIHLELITLIIFGEVYKLRSSSLCSLLQPPATSSLLGPNILFSTLFSNTLNLCSSLSVRDQVSHQHPYKTTRKIMDLYISILNFLQKGQKDKNSAFSELNLLWISSWMQFWFLTIVPKHFNFAIFSKDLLEINKFWLCPTFWWRDIKVKVKSLCLTKHHAVKAYGGVEV
jgi:hypothetical protein